MTPPRHDPLFLGLDCSTQSMTAVVTDARNRYVTELSLRFDDALPQYHVTNGVRRDRSDADVVSVPSLMLVNALDAILERLQADPTIAKRIAADGSFLEQVERISLASSLLASLLIGDFAAIDQSDASGMNLMDISTKTWSSSLLEATVSVGADGEDARARLAERLREALGEATVPSHTVIGATHPYFHRRFGLRADCAIVAFSGDNPCTLAGIGLSRPGTIAISLGTSSTVLTVVPASVDTACAADEGHFFVNPVDTESLMMMVCFKNGSLARENVRDQYAGGSWEVFESLLADSKPGNDGVVGFYFPEPEITPTTAQYTMVMLLRAISSRVRPQRARVAAFHRHAPLAFPEIPFKLADIGEGIAEVEVLQWFVKEGEPIKQFQNVCEVQSDKATVEITSRYDGVVKKIHYNVGEMAKVGTTLIDIDVDDATAASVVESAKPAQSRKGPPTPVGGAAPKAVKPQTPTPKVAAPEPVAPTPRARAAPVVSSARSTSEKVLTSPSVRRLAKEHDIDLADVEGSGPQGRILKEDLLEYIRALAASPPTATTPASTSSAVASSPAVASAAPVTASYLEEDTTVPLTPIQKMMVKSMNAALRIPHFGYADEIEVDALYELRDKLKPVAEARGIKLSFMPFIIKAASLALKHHPSLNATVSEDETQVTMLAAHNISVAMDTPTGLIVPNIKNVQTKSVLDIAADLNRLQALASAGKLAPADLTGGTFSISNIGSVGGTYMSPVIMVPQVAIGAVGKFQTVPRFAKDGSVVPVRIMNVSWSGDHRVIDGATMARFSNKWKLYLENPVSMLSEMS
ncbi:hypothetical protein P43SY_000194 [Pythium insidiosum]|uniref:Dihydrolipoamide acetyltransferase component of pyruvate dehydrogenase complex n=1 Tax=Pythium insidiosum TaxID=114742 RepID=A0AAD5MHH2_PYTIN|nr:hypothetical protein P43SY_000194 [Pythium insidiosum]